MTGTWLTQYTDSDFIEYQIEEQTLDIFLNWPGCDKAVPRPIDLLLIFLQDNSQVEELRETYKNFQGCVFKVVVADNSEAGLAFATEINAKFTSTCRDQDLFLARIVELNNELNELMKKTFDSIDTDNSGFIDMNELTNIASALGHSLAESELKTVFDELDENKDQKISFEEFQKWWKKGRAGKGNAMKQIVGYQTKAKRLLEGAHSEIADVANATDVAEDEVSTMTVDVKVGDAIADSKFGVAARLSTGDNAERDEVASRGGLEEAQKEIFGCLSLKIAEGKDPENARDRISSLITKVTAFISSQNRRADRIFEKLEFKFRINAGCVDIYVIVDSSGPFFQRFDEEVWSNVGGLLNPKVRQEIGGSLKFAKNLNDIRDAGDKKPFEPLLEGFNLSGQLSVWSKLQMLFMKILESEDSYDKSIFLMSLFNGGSFNLNLGSFNEIPEELRNNLRMMAGFIPDATAIFDGILPQMLEGAYGEIRPAKQIRDDLVEYFDADQVKFFGSFRQIHFSANANAGGLGRFV